jgi:hypothetical protein
MVIVCVCVCVCVCVTLLFGLNNRLSKKVSGTDIVIPRVCFSVLNGQSVLVRMSMFVVFLIVL